MPKVKKKNDSVPDYSQYREEPKGHILGQLRKCAQDILKERAEVERLQALMITAQTKLTHLVETVMPMLMEKAQSSDWTSSDGINVKVEEKFNAYISEEHREKAHAWLEKNGLGDYIKRQFIIVFNRNEMAWANKLAKDLRKRKKPLNFEVKQAVHAASLKALVKNIITEGELNLPQKLFGVHRYKAADVTVKKD